MLVDLQDVVNKYLYHETKYSYGLYGVYNPKFRFIHDYCSGLFDGKHFSMLKYFMIDNMGCYYKYMLDNTGNHTFKIHMTKYMDERNCMVYFERGVRCLKFKLAIAKRLMEIIENRINQKIGKI